MSHNFGSLFVYNSESRPINKYMTNRKDAGLKVLKKDSGKTEKQKGLN